jgi:membrane fusion protein (multidrug efflux system)
MIVSTRIFILPAIVFVFSCGNEDDQKAQKQNGPLQGIEGYIVKTQPLNAGFDVNGTVLPNEETTLMSEISGRVVAIHFNEGETVQQGTLLVKLFDGDLQAQLNKLKAQLSNAEIQIQRQSELLKVNGVSQQDYDGTVLQRDVLKADIAMTEAQISKTEIRAPYTGTLGLRRVSPGMMVAPSTAIVTIRDTRSMKLDFSIPENMGASIQSGDTVNFTVYPNPEKFKAVVYATEQSVNAGNLNIQIRAKISEQNTRLLTGSSAQVTLGKISSNSLAIPTKAVVPMARTKTAIVVRGGKATSVDITTGFRTAEYIEVLSGLTAGDTVITTGLQFVRPGVAVKLKSVQ